MARATIMIECGLTSGLGRVRRSLTLAAALQAQGFVITVVLSSPEGATLVEALGFTPSFTLPTDLSAELVVVDTCSTSAADVSRICQSAHKSLVIDDLAERPVHCDYLVNSNLYAHELDYSAYQAGSLFLGPDFALLDPRFYALASEDGCRSGIVISFGGTDDGTLALPVAEACMARMNTRVFIPVPDYVEPVSALAALAETSHLVTLVRGADMPALLGSAEVFVGAAGATVLEALASGCRVCATATQPDQHKNVAFLPKMGVFSVPTYEPTTLADKACEALSSVAAPIAFNRMAAGDIAAVLMADFLPEALLATA